MRDSPNMPRDQRVSEQALDGEQDGPPPPEPCSFKAGECSNVTPRLADDAQAPASSHPRRALLHRPCRLILMRRKGRSSWCLFPWRSKCDGPQRQPLGARSPGMGLTCPLPPEVLDLWTISGHLP